MHHWNKADMYLPICMYPFLHIPAQRGSYNCGYVTVAHIVQVQNLMCLGNIYKFPHRSGHVLKWARIQCKACQYYKKYIHSVSVSRRALAKLQMCFLGFCPWVRLTPSRYCPSIALLQYITWSVESTWAAILISNNSATYLPTVYSKCSKSCRVAATSP